MPSSRRGQTKPFREQLSKVLVVGLVLANVIPYALPFEFLGAPVAYGLTLLIGVIALVRKCSIYWPDIALLIFLLLAGAHSALNVEKINFETLTALSLISSGMVIPSILIRLPGFFHFPWTAIFGLSVLVFIIQFGEEIAGGFETSDFFNGPFLTVYWGHRVFSLVLLGVAIVVIDGLRDRPWASISVFVIISFMFVMADEKFAIVLLLAFGIWLIAKRGWTWFPRTSLGLWSIVLFLVFWFGPGPTIGPGGSIVLSVLEVDGLADATESAGRVEQLDGTESAGRVEQLDGTEIPSSDGGWSPGMAQQGISSFFGLINKFGVTAGIAWALGILLSLFALSSFSARSLAHWISSPAGPLAILILIVMFTWVFAEIPTVAAVLMTFLWLEGQSQPGPGNRLAQPIISTPRPRPPPRNSHSLPEN